SKNAVQFISSFEETMAHMARERGADGVICGHIHHAEIRTIEGIAYLNDGDWVESCTALAEHYDGRWEIIDWAETRGTLPTEAVPEDKPLLEPAFPLPLPTVFRAPQPIP